MAKTITLFFLLSCYIFLSAKAQPISKYLFGQNAWQKGGFVATKTWVVAAKYQTIRIGGNGYENANFIFKEGEKMIDYARSLGAEPILQIPRQLKDDDKAFKAIEYINGTLQKNIKFCSIGNEPDHKNQLATPEEVYDYFTKISEQIKRYDSTIKIIGFDLSSYKLSYQNRLLGGDLDVTKKVMGKSYYYLDIVSLHDYRFADINKIEENIDDLLSKLKTINSQRAASQQITWAFTEFNSHWIVDNKLGENYLPYNFHNGQIFAEMYDLGMRKQAFTICPWSIIEGGADREGTDLSMFDLVDGKYYPRSNYYHTKMLAENFKATYASHTQSNPNLVVIPMVDDDGIAVMILNKDVTNTLYYNINSKKIKSSVNIVKINIQTKKINNYNDLIAAFSTQMLVFNKKGKLVKKYIYTNADAQVMSPPQIIYY